jgi:signal transduction histidine kinase
LSRTSKPADAGAPPARLEFLGALAGGLAHEIKNPLSTIALNLGLLREDLAEAQGAREVRARKRVEILEREVQRLEQVVQDFLRFARGHDLHLEPVSVNDALRELVAFFEPEARRASVSVRTFFDPAAPRARLDRSAVRQAFLNLLVNAREAMPSGGDLLLGTRREGGEVVVEITDTGVGMTKETLERCFQPYFSTKRGGTGLGLATTRRIVEELGGRIEVWSEVGRGTSFRLRFPGIAEEEA